MVFISLVGEFEVVFDGLSPKETDPEIKCWISGFPSTLSAYNHGLIQKARKTVLNIEYNDSRIDESIRYDTSLEFDYFFFATNSDNLKCKIYGGCCSISLTKLRDNTNKKLELEIKNPMANDYRKGIIRLTINKLKCSVILERTEYDYCIENKEKLDSEIVAFENRRQKVFRPYGNMKFSMQPSSNIIKENNLPFYMTRSGIIPPEIYWMNRNESGSINRKFYSLILKFVMIHRSESYEYIVNIAKKQFSTTTSRLNPKFHKVTEILGEMVCFFSNCLPYISDICYPNINDKKRRDPRIPIIIESFDDVFIRMCGDCEDLSQCIVRFIDWLRYMEFDKREDELLYYLKRTLTLYIEFGVLGNVTSKAVVKVDDDPDCIGLHMFALLITKQYFYFMKEACCPNVIGINREDDRDYDESGNAVVYEWAKDLEILILEGTGRVNPIQKPSFRDSNNSKDEEVLKLKRYVMALSDLKSNDFINKLHYPCIQTNISYDYREFEENQKRLSAFYLTVVHGYTFYFYKKFKNHFTSDKIITRWAFVYNNSGKLEYGVCIEDLLYKKYNVGIFPMTPIPESITKICESKLRHLSPTILPDTPYATVSFNPKIIYDSNNTVDSNTYVDFFYNGRELNSESETQILSVSKIKVVKRIEIYKMILSKKSNQPIIGTNMIRIHCIV